MFRTAKLDMGKEEIDGGVGWGGRFTLLREENATHVILSE